MRLKLTALAASVLVLSQPATAQNSVTLYGIVDTGVQFYNNAATGGSVVGMPSLTGAVPSRFGFRGVEGLGGGLKAFFNLESGFAVSTGQLNVSAGVKPTLNDGARLSESLKNKGACAAPLS